MSCQEFQPCLEYTDDPAETIQVLVDAKEASYSGGGNITFRGFLEDGAFFSKRLFHGELELGNQPLHITYSVKSNRESLLGLSFQFSSSQNKTSSILIASNKPNQLSSSFSKVITTHQVSGPEKWVIHNCSIAMNKHILSEIRATCYRLQPEHSESRSEGTACSEDISPSLCPNYFAALGHISIKDSEENTSFPPSDAWIIEAQNISISSATQESKIVSVKLIWQLKDGKKFLCSKYNIYVEKMEKQDEGNPGEEVKGTCMYLGEAKVAAFYVSGLAILSDTHSLRFIIQVCDSHGASQKLVDSPYFLLNVEGQ